VAMVLLAPFLKIAKVHEQSQLLAYVLEAAFESK
jgi:hypothetical protein